MRPLDCNGKGEWEASRWVGLESTHHWKALAEMPAGRNSSRGPAIHRPVHIVLYRLNCDRAWVAF